MTMTTFEIEALDLVSWEEERECTPAGEDCGIKAEWLGVLHCCGADIPLCQSHKDVTDGMTYPDTKYTCSLCGASSIGSFWHWVKL